MNRWGECSPHRIVKLPLAWLRAGLSTSIWGYFVCPHPLSVPHPLSRIPGAGTALKDAARLAATYGGDEVDWVKVASSHVTPPGGAGGFDMAGYNGGFEVHAYQNVKTGQIVELKTKFQ
jgi:hypothetical protein